MAPEVRRISEIDSGNHTLPPAPENPAPETLDERGFHIWLRDTLYTPREEDGLILASLAVPTGRDTLRSVTSACVASHVLHADVVLEADFLLRPPADYEGERARAWRRTDLRQYDTTAPTYRAREINAGREILRISASHGPGQPTTSLIKSTATLRTAPKGRLEIAEVEVLVGSHTPFRELLLPNEDGFIRRKDIQLFLGHLAHDSQTLLAA